MESTLTTAHTVSAELQEKVLLGGDLSRLTPQERLSYYNAVCASVGLNPYTRPFEYITLNNRLTLYARKDCTDQLRKRDGISLTIPVREVHEGIYVVTARAATVEGRTDESTGAVPIDNLKGEFRANAMMKAETKAKRRVTLSICGLGMLDETEVEDIPDTKVSVEQSKQTARTKIGELMKEGATLGATGVTEAGGDAVSAASSDTAAPPTAAPSICLTLTEVLDRLALTELPAEIIPLANRGMQLAQTQKERKQIMEAKEAAQKRLGVA